MCYPNRRARAGSRLATSAQPPRATSPFSLCVSSQHAPQPIRFIVPFETPGALLEGLRCLPASRPLPTPNEFQGKTMPRFLLITDSRLSENDRQNVFLEELMVGPQLDPRAVLELGQDVRRCFFSVSPDEVRAWVGLNQPARSERGKRRAQGKVKVARATTRGARRSVSTPRTFSEMQVVCRIYGRCKTTSQANISFQYPRKQHS